jgi:ribonuclease J
MQLTIYRGTKEVGGTMIELKSGKTRILLDAGYPLFYRGEVIEDDWVGKSFDELKELGVIPDVKGLYRRDRPRFDAVLISHAHSDHFGLLKHIHPDIPIYLSEVTDKLIEMNLRFHIPDYENRDRRIVPMYQSFCIGNFTMKAFLTDHSAYHASAFQIQSEGKTVLYTGDFRNHGRRPEYLDRLLREAEKEPDLLLVEGTTLGRTGEPERTEEDLEAEFREMIRASAGIVLCQSASQNIDRVISFYNAARACGKIFVMDNYTANVLSELKKLTHENLPVPSLRHPDVRVYHPILLTRKMKKILGRTCSGRFRASTVSVKMIGRKQKRIVMLIRPSALPDIKLMGLKDGILIYSQWQAYREKAYQIRLESYLESVGFSDCYLHTSGHAFEEDIKKVIRGLSPKEIVPIHTFFPEAFLQFGHKVTLQKDGVPFSI